MLDVDVLRAVIGDGHPRAMEGNDTAMAIIYTHTSFDVHNDFENTVLGESGRPIQIMAPFSLDGHGQPKQRKQMAQFACTQIESLAAGCRPWQAELPGNKQNWVKCCYVVYALL